MLTEADHLTERLRTTADAVAAAALSTAGQPDDAFDDRLTDISDDVQRYLRDDLASHPMEAAFRNQLDTWLKGSRSEPIRPFHWPLEFPEVMDSGGFSAVVSNPPFMGGQTLTGRIGEDVREYLVNYVGRGKRGSADLCSYFLLRDLSVAQQGPGRHHRDQHDRPGRYPGGRPRPDHRRRPMDHLPREQVPALAWDRSR